ncbi:hypothetical protein AgCh_010378 [Apium graveolens]
MYENLIIAYEEDESIVVFNDENIERPKEVMEIHDLGGYRYSFVFYHKLDLQKVVDGGPWSFEQAMLINHQLKEYEDPSTIPLSNTDIWVQVYDIPRGHSERDCNVVYANPDKIVDRAYGVWLRALAENVNMNAGSRWLRNIADKNKAWTSKSTSSEQSNTDHGRSGGQKDTKFMEMDGVVREFGAENSALTIKGHTNGDIDMGEKFKKQLEGFEGVDSGLNEGISFESKRKRVKENVREEKRRII